MPANQRIKIGPLKRSELEEADRIVRLAFGTFLGLPNPLDFMGDRTFMIPRWHSAHVKVIAAREGKRFDELLDACEDFAASRGAIIEAGTNLAREDAYRRMRSSGYRVETQGVAMQRPHADGLNRSDAYVIDDWR